MRVMEARAAPLRFLAWLRNNWAIITFHCDSFGIGNWPDPFLFAKVAGPPDYHVAGFLIVFKWSVSVRSKSKDTYM